MLTSEKQAGQRGPWQVKTREGIYYQPDSLYSLYQWIFDNRLCADDFIFSAKEDDWIPIYNMPELKGCFWRLLTSENVVYGPVSIGELKQLYINKQINPNDKVSILGKENWARIDEVGILRDWLDTIETTVIDYIRFVDKLEGELELRKGGPKEEKVRKKIHELEKQNKENIKQLKDLEISNKELEKELLIKTRELEELIGVKNELGALQAELKEKTVLIEELNKNIAQMEVTRTLKDDEISQLQSSINSLQDNLKETREENDRLQQSLPEAIKDLEEKIEELNSKNREFEMEMRELQDVVSKDEKEINFYKEEAANLQIELDEKNSTIEEITNNTSELEAIIQKKEEEVVHLTEAVSGKEQEIIGYKDTIARLQGELAERDRAIVDASVLNVELDSYRTEIASLQEESKQRAEEIESLLVERENLNKELTQQREKLTEEIKLKENTISELRRNLDVVKEEKDNLEAEGNKLKEENRQKAERLEALLEEKENLAAEGNSLREENRQSSERLEALVSEKENLEVEVNKLMEEIDLKENTINELRRSLESLNDETRQKVEGLIGEKESLEVEADGLKGEIEAMESTIAELKSNLESLQAEKEGLRTEWGKLREENKQKSERIEALLAEKENLSNELVRLGQQYEEGLRIESNKFREELRSREDTIVELKNRLERLQEEYTTNIKELEDAMAAQKAQSQRDLVEKTKIWEESLKIEREQWNALRQDLEGSIVQKDAQIEGQRLEIGRLQDTLISLDKQWKERVRTIKEEGEKTYRELERQREDLRIELSQKINEFTAEKEYLQTRLVDAENRRSELTQQKDTLEKELLDRDRFIDLIKDEAAEKEESYKNRLKDSEEKLYQANTEIEKLQANKEELTAQLQNELDIQEGLRRDISTINEELNSTRQLVSEIQRGKEETQEIKLRLERELEEAKRNLEHSHEENRSLQKQFYIEKQKLTKDYNETIGKLEKLKKREQLEREIQDRTRMKEELERLYNLIRENFDGLQRGAQEIQASLQGLGEDIDNKRLSLKYMTETEKREEKKGQFPRIEATEEADTTT